MTENLNKEIDELWEAYKTRQDPTARDGLILHYAPLVKFIANRMASILPSLVERADLVSYGIFGLIDAIEKFERDRKFKFETYALTRIRGAIFDGLRSMDWVPRSVRSKSKIIEQAMSKLELRFGRSPTDEELASDLEMSVTNLQSIYSELSFLTVLGLEEIFRSADGSDFQSLRVRDVLSDPQSDPSGSYEENELRAQIVSAIAELTLQERKVMMLYYFEGLTLADIGRVIGVTEGRVSQIHTKAIINLRVKLELYRSQPD